MAVDRPTIARALIWREADVGDQHRFPSRPIPAGGHASLLPAEPEVDLRVSAPGGDNGTARLDDVLHGTDTRAFVVVHRGRVYERYDGDSGPKTLETSFSVAKSFVSTLVGIALDEGLIGAVDDPVTRYVPELAARDPRFKQIILRDLLTMSSGLRYQESSFPSPRGDDTYTYTYYGVDLGKDALERTEIEQAPGEKWHYNNYNPLLLGLVLERATGMSVSGYMASRLWQPLGAGSDASWSLDSKRLGFEKMESGLNATALDHARFGLLLLHGGEWNGRRIVLASGSAPPPGSTRRPTSQPGPVRNVSPAANEHEQAGFRRQVADDVVALLGVDEGQAGVAGLTRHLSCQTGASLPTVTAPRLCDTRYPPIGAGTWLPVLALRAAP
jgi:CubicO group peptidase (beta-lactamase class C family)